MATLATLAAGTPCPVLALEFKGQATARPVAKQGRATSPLLRFEPIVPIRYHTAVVLGEGGDSGSAFWTFYNATGNQ